MRLVLPALAVWLGMWLITGWGWGLWVVCGGCGLCCVLLGVSAWMRRRGARTLNRLTVGVVGLMLASCALVGGLRVFSTAHGPLAEGAANHSIADVDVVVRNSRVSPNWGMAIVTAECQRVTIAGQTHRLRQPVAVLAPSQFADQWLAYPAGTVVQVSVKLGPADQGQPEAAVMAPVGDSHSIRGPPIWQRVIESMRTGLAGAMGRNPAEQAALVPALVVGDTSAVPASLSDDFRSTGLTHLMAVSGANLAILLSFLSVVARQCGVRGRWLTVVSVIGVAVFIALCHSEPSVLRAAAMGIVSLVAVGRGAGAGSGLPGMCLAVMGLCWIDPWMSRSMGFILSVLACLGIIVWGRRWAQVLERWLPSWVAEAMAIPLAAQVATQPVICYLSGAVSVAGLIANAAAGPWVAPATVIGLVAALISPVSGTVASWAGYVAGWCAEPILLVGDGLAGLPGASHPWPATVVGLGVVVFACGVAAWVMPRILDKAWIVLTVTAVLVATMLIAPFQPGWPGQWRIAACDVGQGDAIVVRTGASGAVMFDVGPPDSSVVSCLDQLGVKEIPLVVLSHFHADHAGAFSEVAASFSIGSLLVPSGGGDGTTVLNLAREKGIPVSIGRTGLHAQVGDLQITVVSAWQSGVVESSNGEESSEDNDQSLIVRVDSPEMSMLDTGDVEILGQQTALKNPADLEVDVLKVPHHGSARQDPDFLEATHASIALISVGANNSYGHPADKTVKELVNDGMEVVRTDEHGSISLSREGTWTITTQK